MLDFKTKHTKECLFCNRQGDNVVTVHGDKSVSKTPPFEIEEHWSVKKEDIIFLESQQNYHFQEIEDIRG